MRTQRTNASALPVSLLQVKDHLRVTHDFEDEVIQGMTASAVAEIEAFADLALMPQTISAWTYEEVSGDVELPIGPVEDGAALTVQTIGTDGTLTTLTGGYWLEAGRYPVLHLTTPPNARLRITYAAGFISLPHDLGRGNIKEDRIEYQRQKTSKNPNGILVSIPVHPFLAETLKNVQAGAFTFLGTTQGKARTATGLGTAMRKWCDKAGLPLCSSHGLRKAICRRIIEAGGQPHELMSVSGHITLAEAQRYAEAFGRKGLADSAIGRLPSGAKPEQTLVNHPKRFTTKSTNQLK